MSKPFTLSDVINNNESHWNLMNDITTVRVSNVAMMAATDVFLRSLLGNIIEAEGFSDGDNNKISFAAGSQAGDGFLAINRSIKIENSEKVLHLFAKTAPTNDMVRNQMNIKMLFAREILFYRVVYPEFAKFQKERGIQKPFEEVTRCHSTSIDDFNEVLVLDDLRAQGYVMFDTKIKMNEAHIIFVFKLCARFHAVSYAMKDQNPERYERLAENMNDLFAVCFKSANIGAAMTNYAEGARKFFDPVEEAVVSDRIANLTDIILRCAEKACEFVDEYSVITHGDCWCNNFMFKYKDAADPTLPEDIKILDWQIMRVNSPVLDLAYFFYTTASREVMANLDFYLETYHQALSESIREMGSDPEKLYPYSVFVDHWKRFSRFGLTMALPILKIMLADKEEVPKTTENVDTEMSFGDAFEYEIKNEEIYKERVRDIIQHFVYKDFI